MAFETNVFKVPGLEANGDLSSHQFKAVKGVNTNRRVRLCDTRGEIVFGILQNNPDTAGKAAEVMALGVSKMIAGETLVAGDYWGTDASGLAIKVRDFGGSPQILSEYAAGMVLEGGAVNEKITVSIGFPTFTNTMQ